MKDRIGDIVRRAREDRGLSQEQLSAVSGISQASISQVENGRRGLSAQTAASLSRTLGLELEVLLGESPSLIRIQGELSAWRAYEDARSAFQGLCHHLADLRDGLVPFETLLAGKMTSANGRLALDQLLTRDPDFVESQRKRVVPKEQRVEYMQHRSAVSVELTQRLREIISTVEVLQPEDQDLLLAIAERLSIERMRTQSDVESSQGGGA